MDKEQGQTPADGRTSKPKIKKLTMANSQTQSQSQSQSQSQPIGELLDHTRRIDPMENANSEELLQVWSQSKENPITVTEDQIEQLEDEKYLEEIERENRDLQDRISKQKQKNDKMAKYIEEKVQSREEIFAKQNIVNNMMAMVREHMNALTNELTQTEGSLDHLEGLYETLNSEEEEATKILADRLRDAVAKTEKYEAEIRLTDEELTIANARYEEAKNKVDKEKQKVAEANCQLEELIATIERNEEEHEAQMAKKIEKKNLLEQRLKMAQEENRNIDAQYKESLKITNEFLAEVETLRAEDTADANEVEFLKSELLRNQELEAELNNELEDVKNSNIALVSNRDSEKAKYRKQLQDLVSTNVKMAKNLEEAALDYKDRSMTLAEATKHKKQLEEAVKDKDNEIKKLTIEVNGALKNNKELLASIGDLKAELSANENELKENRADFKARKDQQKMNNEAKIAAGRAEVAAAKKLLSEISDQLTEETKMANDKKLKTWTELKILQDEMLQKKRLVNEERQILNDLQLKIEKNRLDAQENLPNHCQQLEHVERIKQNGKEIESLTKQLSAEKSKLNQLKRKNKEAERREIEKQAAQDRKHKSLVDNLKKKLATIEREIEDIDKEEKDEADREAIPKSILRSGSKSPLRGQKVQFDLETSSETSLAKADSSSTIIVGESRPAATESEPDCAIVNPPTSLQQTEMPSSTFNFAGLRQKYQATANKPDWSKIGFPESLQKPQTPSQAAEVPKPTTPKKFFKSKDSQ